ncbi:hypothetical protein HCN44_007898 [Aphidius gifuensis]|uniref:G-protein coupled receptors family 1 profile domain-containing protein n=1 Tax=Aphidius gifuensis TaxID=684658 RepID=A0A835CUI9_APHGI|nr:hypothetical protein HCN44_007898 [Aphidius gifuensis]
MTIGISNLMYKQIAFVLGAVGLLGLIFNLLVIIVIIKDSSNSWTPTNVVLVNLAISDFLVAFFGNPLAFISALNRGWYWSTSTCKWYACLMSTFGLASIGNLTVMALERWMLITNPTRPLSTRSAMYFASFVWVYALVQSLPPLLGWGSYGPEGGNVSCSVSWEIHDSTTHNDSYIAFIFIFGLIIPLIIILSSYFGIIIKLKRVRQRIGSRSKRELKVTKMIGIMITAFLIAWMPYAIFAIAAQYFHFQPSASIAILPSLLAKSSICYNPIIYAFLSSQFTQSFKHFFGIQDNAISRQQQDLSHGTWITLTTRIEKV